MQIHPEIRQAIDSIAAQYKPTDLRRAAAAVSARYRDHAARDVRIQSAEEACAYLVTRFPATFTAARTVLAQLGNEAAPASVLDIGAGPGTVALAAMTYWPEMEQATLVEPNPHLRRAGMMIFDALGLSDRVRWIEGDIRTVRPLPAADLVVAGYVMNEVLRGGDSPAAVADAIWAAAQKALVLIEPGTPVGYNIINGFRNHLLGAGAAMVAPCPHAQTCPVAGQQSWCHFSARVERSKLHRMVKDGAALGYEDEKFSYIALSRRAHDLPAARIIGHPAHSKVLQIPVCLSAGVAKTLQIAKSDPQFKALRKLGWGDPIGEEA